jgi:hypothetical protein
MIKKILLSFLFCISALGQNAAIQIKINSITANNDNPKARVFIINYQIENKTVKPISFFLNPERIVSQAASKMTLLPIYKIYINGVETNLDGPFLEKDGINWVQKFENIVDYDSAEAQSITKQVYIDIVAQDKITVDNFRKNNTSKQEAYWIIDRNKILNAKIKLNPKEIKKFTIQTSWNLERYFEQDDIEYLLDERDKYKFELVLDLKKTTFKDCLLPEEFAALEKDKNCIEGIFKSNQVDINFK